MNQEIIKIDVIKEQKMSNNPKSRVHAAMGTPSKTPRRLKKLTPS